MADVTMPGEWLEAEIRRLIEEGEGFDFEDLTELVSRRDRKMDSVEEGYGSSQSLPPIIARSREDVLELINSLVEHYQFPVILGDVFALAVRLTAQVARFGDERINQALGDWFCLIEEDTNLGDNDLAPKLVFNECRKALI
jgi:hypothetical protein